MALPDLKKLRDAKKLVDEATEPDMDLDNTIARLFNVPGRFYTHSLDAIVELIKAVFGNRNWEIHYICGKYHANIEGSDNFIDEHGGFPRAALALLSVVLAAKIAEVEAHAEV